MRLLFVTCLCAAVSLSTCAENEDGFITKRQEILTATMQVNNLQGSSFEGVFDFPLKENVVGWKATITFNIPITNIMMYDGDSISHSTDGTTWVFVNKNYKAVYKSGTTLELKFNAAYSGSVKPSGHVSLQNMGYDSWSVPEAKNTGDHVKFNFPMAYTVTALAWGYLEYPEAYRSAGQEDFLLDGIKWALDYLLKCHTGPEELYVQVGDAGQDHGFWGPPEQMKMPRPAFKITAAKPGSDIAMETAAAMAAGYLVFKTKDPTYAATLLTHSKQLWEFGNKHHGRYSDSVPQAAGFYTSNNYTDELGWGSIWLHKATNDGKYLAEAERQFDSEPAWGQSWDEKTFGNQILLYKATHNDRYKTAITNSFLGWLPGGKVPYTPKGLAFRLQWGSLRYSSNMAMAALIAADAGILTNDLRHWAMCQIHYVLGDTGFSYVVGFGKSYPHSPHHRSSSCPSSPAPCGSDVMNSGIPNVHTLYGAMVGGPGQNDDYKDDRTNFVNNEVACDYNAGLQGAVAGLKHLMMTGQHPEKIGNAACPFHSGTVIGRRNIF